MMENSAQVLLMANTALGHSALRQCCSVTQCLSNNALEHSVLEHTALGHDGKIGPGFAHGPTRHVQWLPKCSLVKKSNSLTK